MHRIKVRPQVVRLLLLTLAIVTVYFLARAALTPASFGEYGWYRADALREMAALPPVFASKKECEECHSDVLTKLSKSEHKSLACTTCHGSGRLHVDDPEEKIGKPTDSFCLRCHQEDPARPKWLHQIKPREHYRGQRCIECHMPHQPNETP